MHNASGMQEAQPLEAIPHHAFTTSFPNLCAVKLCDMSNPPWKRPEEDGSVGHVWILPARHGAAVSLRALHQAVHNHVNCSSVAVATCRLVSCADGRLGTASGLQGASAALKPNGSSFQPTAASPPAAPLTAADSQHPLLPWGGVNQPSFTSRVLRLITTQMRGRRKVGRIMVTLTMNACTSEDMSTTDSLKTTPTTLL